MERARTSWMASCQEPIIRFAGNAGTSIGSSMAGALGIVNGVAGWPAPAAPAGRGVVGCATVGWTATGWTGAGCPGTGCSTVWAAALDERDAKTERRMSAENPFTG